MTTNSSTSERATLAVCRCCGGELEVLLDFGPQPVCSHFMNEANAEATRHPLALVRCLNCGQLQLRDPAPVSLLRSPHAWISYIEPEGHLDRLVDELCARPGAGSHLRVGGVTYKDATTLERLRKRGWNDLWQLDPSTDLDITDGGADLAIIQEQLTPARARRAAEKHGRADILLVRHILEHAHDPAAFLSAIKELVAPGGVAVFEVPDAQQAFLHREYTVVWEEHVLYFTPELFGRVFGHFGMRLDRLRIFPYPVENTLIAFVDPHRAETTSRRPSAPMLADEQRQMRRYADDFPRQRAAWRGWLKQVPGGVAAFGAGHSTCAFINFFELGDCFAFVADDHPKKQGLFLPGCHVPVRPSAQLIESGVTQCLMGLSPESEAKVMARQEAAVKRGVQFVSLFPMSARAVPAIKNRGSMQAAVFTLDQELPVLRDEAIAELREKVRFTPRSRNRFCAHGSAAELLHEMVICLYATTYIRPHRHHGRAESILVIEGFADLLLFDERGSVARIVRLGPRGSNLTWYVRLPDPVFHALVLRSEDFVFQETTLGPFRPETTEMAAWAPDEADIGAVANYQAALLGAAVTGLPNSACGRIR